MLVIARKVGQRILIGSDIEVFVTEISRKSVRLGIKAPRTLTVVRGEIVENVEAENRAAAQVSLEELQHLGAPPATRDAAGVSPMKLGARTKAAEKPPTPRQPDGDDDRQREDD